MTFNLPWQGKNNILVATHAFADPDALGSLLALGSFLKKRVSNVDLFAYGGAPSNLRFLLGEHSVHDGYINPAAYDLIVTLDCADPNLLRFPGLLEKKSAPLVNIDHHPDNSNFGDVNLVDSSYAAAAEMVYEIFMQEQAVPDSFEATAMLAGIMGDTGSFRYSNTTSQTLRIAGELLEYGARFSQIVRHLFSGKDPDQLKAWSYVLENAHFDKTSGAIISAITQEDIDKLNVEDDAFNGIVEILNTFPGANYAAFLRQRGDEIRVSLRSEVYKGQNVKELAQKFGGGGHDLSAGFSVPGKLVREREMIYILPI